MTLESKGTEFAAFLVLGFFVFAGSFTRSGNRFFTGIENFGSRFSQKKGRAIVSIAAAAILLRVAMLPFISAPFPQVHDEFSYLLAADTFAHGRLTNPPHPLSLYFDTFHVNQHPTYMSKYPPAQGAALAIGQRLGNPWIGVLLSVAAMVAAVVWALQAWLPAPWAFLGGILVLCRFGLFGYWINSYWGGAVPALGGALVIGAFIRVIRSWRPADAVILALGMAILANSRPFEGLIFSIPVLAALVFAMFRKEAPAWKDVVRRCVLPFATVMVLCFLFMGYYNWRGTGNPFLFPYILNDHAYLSATPVLLWQKSTPARQFVNPQFDAFYNGWAQTNWEESRATDIRAACHLFVAHLKLYAHYFLWPELCVPFLALFWVLRDRRFRFLWIQIVICLGGFVLVDWFQPHYAAPALVSLFALVAAGLWHIRKWTYRQRPMGIGLSRAVVFFAIISAPFHFQPVPPDLSGREHIASELSREPGKQLVIVHYSTQHDPTAEWVYNSARIDEAQIVWAREIPGVSLSPLLNYFSGYRVWIVDADSSSPTVRPYDAQASAIESRTPPGKTESPRRANEAEIALMRSVKRYP